MEVETLAAEIQTGVQHRNGPPLDSSQSTSWSLSLGRPFFMALLTIEPGRNRSQPTATVIAFLSRFATPPICARLPPVATTGLHKGSIRCNQPRQQDPVSRVSSLR